METDIGSTPRGRESVSWAAQPLAGQPNLRFLFRPTFGEARSERKGREPDDPTPVQKHTHIGLASRQQSALEATVE